MATRNKRQRQLELTAVIDLEPFLTDEELADRFEVSVQTIRLDRLALGIPELRERIKAVAEQNYTEVRSLESTEVIGELIELDLNSLAISIMEIGPEHVFSRTKIARGHHLFAQANSLAVGIIDAETVLTGSADVRYKRPVKLGERLVCKAVVKELRGERARVEVTTKVRDDIVFDGQFVVFKM
ncbi:fatty acid biosynthesis transcriptional regulator [Tumebacillus algifaecis]|uniref:Fatty acid biosynthesis transcriptional regulator n=1 Tax=Tumebacillus algifaecis TaxID=1214604 RepID=A0A223D2F0_9BACL|nr:transcription factor FapR [Tumebacillus algifaecis]ASS75701.1 fatty acid biosynthesis transcriptional regulator [Tumebacillus algifaecis]